jgi:exonuclease V gamma subunit
MSGSEKILLETILDSRYRLYDLHWQVKKTGELLFLSDYDNDRAYLEFYLAHLVNTIQTNGTAAEPAQAILKTKLITLPVLSLDDAKTRLTALFKIAEEAQNRPLPVFPVISKSFAQNGNLDKAIEGFEEACLAGDDNAQQLQKFFGKTPFADKEFSDEFQQLACLIYQPWYKPVQAAAQEENNNE